MKEGTKMTNQSNQNIQSSEANENNVVGDEPIDTLGL
jgi:hypothetical protein